MSGDEIFGYGWREDHARAGDEAMVKAEEHRAWPVQATMYVAIAQAHYAAANICTRPIRDAELPVTDLDWMTRERSG